MNPHPKGINTTLDSCRSHRDRNGWKLREEELKIVEMEGKWYGVEESDNPKLIKRLPLLGNNLDALGRLTDAVKKPRRQLRAGRQAAAYLMGDASGTGFGSVLWGRGRLSLESGEFCNLYHGRSPNFR